MIIGGYFAFKKLHNIHQGVTMDDSLVQKLGLNPNDDPFVNARRFVDYQAKRVHENAYTTFNQYVHPDADKRAAGKELTELITKEMNELGSSAAVYKMISGGNPENMSGDDKLMYDDLINNMRRNGCHLDEATNARCKEISEEIIKLSSDFNKNVTESLPVVEVGDELAALSDFCKKYGVVIPEDNILQFRGYGLYTKIMKFCPVESVRRKTFINFSNVAKDNLEILDKLQALRDERAALLGFKNHAAFILDNNSAKTPDVALEFLGNFRSEVMKHADKEDKNICETLEIDRADLHKVYNSGYYMEQYRIKKYNVDANEYKQYFELESVLNTMMQVYEGFFDVTFVKVAATVGESWHPDVRTFSVVDNKNKNSGAFLGIIHLDLMGRDGKWQHPSNFPLMRRHEYLEKRSDNSSSDTPVQALVTSFEKTSNGPVLLLHSEVVTLFHEFGHSMHEILNQKKYCTIGATAVAPDLVEVPSMYLEYLIWDKAFLRKVGRHYKTDKPLTSDEIDRLVSTKHIGSVSYFLKQIAYALFDL